MTFSFLRPRRAGLLAAPAVFWLLSHAQAQTPPDAPAAAELREVRVDGTAERSTGFAPTEAQSAGKAPMRQLETPQSVGVVSQEQMESRQVVNLQQALQTVAGVSPVTFGRRGFDDINIRGFRSSESILIDGLVQNGGWLPLRPTGYERIEVLKGAASVLYGQVQPGGLVNAVSKRPQPVALGELSFDVGSFGQRAVSADVNRPLSESGKAALRINASIANAGDPTDFVFRRDRYVAPSLSLDLGPDTDFTLLASYQQATWLRQQGVTPYGTVLPNRNGSVPLTRFTGDPAFGNYDVEKTTLGYLLQHRFAPALVLRQSVRYEKEQGTGNFVSNNAIAANQRLQPRLATRQYTDNDLLATDTSVMAGFETAGLRHRVVAGMDARHGTALLASRRCTIGALDLFAPVYGVPASCPVDLSADAPSTLTTVGLYLQDQIRFGQGWTALLGLRRDRSRVDIDNRVAGQRSVQKDGATVGSAGLVYAFMPGWSVYGSYGESFLPVQGLSFAGAPFKPETGHQWETGIKYEAPDRRITSALALYDLTRQNLTTADVANTGFSVQTGEQRSRGLEWEVGADLRGGLKLTGSYTYTDSRVTRDTNTALVGSALNLTPRHVATAWATWRVPQWPGVTVGLGGRYVSEQIGSYPFALPAYAVADASVSYTAGAYRLTLGVKNLTDRRYYDGAINANVVAPGLPRSATLSGTFFF